MGEQLIAAQHGLQFFYGMHGSSSRRLICGLPYHQLLVIVLAQRVKSISIIGNHFHRIERIIP